MNNLMPDCTSDVKLSADEFSILLRWLSWRVEIDVEPRLNCFEQHLTVFSHQIGYFKNIIAYDHATLTVNTIICTPSRC